MEEEITLIENRPLKTGEIKTMLTRQVKLELPGFRFLTYATGVYHFQRLRDFGDYDLREVLHAVYSFDDNTMRASVSSRLNFMHALSPIYNDGFINPHADLLALKLNLGIYPRDNTIYHCDGTLDGARSTIAQMVADFKDSGLRYLDTRWESLRSNKLVEAGLHIIDSWDFDKTMLRNEIDKQLRKAKFVIPRLRHPVCTQLKEQLTSIPDQSPEMQHEIPRLAFDLIELYCTSRITS